MDEQKKYSPFKLQRRDVPEDIARAGRANMAASGMNGQPSGTASGMNGQTSKAPIVASEYAEIDIEPDDGRMSANERALRLFAPTAQPAKIEQKPLDPLRMKFFEMRRLGIGRPYARDNSELFYRQAKLMEEFSDDYDGDAKLSMYYINYQTMGYEQLRTYFSWRTKVRKGIIAPISSSYVFLYAYELLNNIGVANPADGLNKLVDVWDKCMRFAPVLEKYLPQWFKDYFIFYGQPDSFSDFVMEHGLMNYFSEMHLFDDHFEDKLRLWNSISAYNVMKSKFWLDGNEQLFRDCFNTVLAAMQELCESCDKSLVDLIIYKVSNRTPWRPFKQALFYNWRKQQDRVVNFPGGESYFCKNNRWMASVPIYYSTQKDFVGFVLKKTEACLRKTVNYKYKLSAEVGSWHARSHNELKLIRGGVGALESTIERAVASYYRDINRTIVTIDHANLARIRREALGTQEILIVPESVVEAGGAFVELDGATAEAGGVAVEVELEHAAVEQSAAEAEFELAAVEDASSEFFDIGDTATEGMADEWSDFGNALSPAELRALAIICSGSGSIKKYADEIGIMLEVLADNINDKAADIIGDSILDSGIEMSIFAEYVDNVAWVVNTFS